MVGRQPSSPAEFSSPSAWHDWNMHLPAGEYSLPRALKGLGYATGHFGKWHVGVLSADDKHGSGRSEVAADVAPPWERDFEVLPNRRPGCIEH